MYTYGKCFLYSNIINFRQFYIKIIEYLPVEITYDIFCNQNMHVKI